MSYINLYRLDPMNALVLPVFSSEVVSETRPSGSHSASFCVPPGSNFGHSPNAASYISILADLGLLNAMARSKSSPEVFCSKCTLWVLPSLLNLPTLISRPPDLQMRRAARRRTSCTSQDGVLLPESPK